MQYRNAWPIAATTGAVAAAAVSGWFARDARDYSRTQFDRAVGKFTSLAETMLDDLAPREPQPPQPSKPQLRVIQGGAS